MIKKIALYLFLSVTGLATLIPFIWMVSASLMYDGHASTYPPRFIPDEFTLYQFQSLFSRLNVARNLFNSLVLSILVTIISLFFN